MPIEWPSWSLEIIEYSRASDEILSIQSERGSNTFRMLSRWQRSSSEVRQISSHRSESSRQMSSLSDMISESRWRNSENSFLISKSWGSEDMRPSGGRVVSSERWEDNYRHQKSHLNHDFIKDAIFVQNQDLLVSSCFFASFRGVSASGGRIFWSSMIILLSVIFSSPDAPQNTTGIV